MSPAAAALLTPEAVRERAQSLLALGLDDRLLHWRVRPEALGDAAAVVAAVVRDRFPELRVPPHARWRHLLPAGAALVESLPGDPAERLRAEWDLVVVSVLLDAGAGPAWRWRDPVTGAETGRSEGLALASLAAFAAGAFALDGASPRADAKRLAAVTEGDLAAIFQVGPDNPLAGLAGRAALLRRLGEVLHAAPAAFGTPARPAGLVDLLGEGPISARALLVGLLHHLGPIWPGREEIDGIGLGDCWRHPGIRRADATAGLIPFHKLSQWLAYSLAETLVRAGREVIGLDALTGLAEYRNGGLFVDAGVILPREPRRLAVAHPPGAPLVVEWRALTVALLDRIAPLVRERLGLDAAALPLASVLEGGTWWAGRRLAAELRDGGGPPVLIESDGTVF